MPVEIIKRIKAELEAARVFAPEQISLQYSYDRNRELDHLYPFNLFNGKWFVNGNGGGGCRLDGQIAVFQWITRRLFTGSTPEEIVAIAEDQILANSLNVWEITKVAGITVADIVELTNDAWLFPNKQLPDTPTKKSAFVEWISMIGQPIQTDTAALVRQFAASPIYIDANDDKLRSELETSRMAEQTARSDFIHRLKYALLLQGNGPVEMEITYAATGEDNIIPAGSGTWSMLHSSHIFQNQTPDVPQTLYWLRKIEEFNKPSAMYLAIERLGRARGGFDAVNKIIDLGMALEIALMHDDQNAKEEITAKTGLRAGWLLGTTPEERLAIKRSASKLYGARSKAVHTGKVDAKLDLTTADQLVVSVLKKILDRGAFPEWDALVFGAV